MNLFKKAYNKFFDKGLRNQKISFSQCGEDLIIDFLFTHILEIRNLTYMDVGAHHPFYLNNTYLFYKRGLSGINIEPDPSLFVDIARFRPNDININKGVGFNAKNKMADFYIMSASTLNTFSREEAERISKAGHITIKEIRQVELININDILTKHHSLKPLDFLSLDVEGYDFEIVKSIDLEKFKPKVMCVETLIFSEGRSKIKKEETINFLKENGYLIYADTYINTIFVRKDIY